MLGEGGRYVKEQQERENKKIMRNEKKKKRKKPKAKRLKRNGIITPRGTNRGGRETFHNTELRKFLPNGAFPEVLGGWEL